MALGLFLHQETIPVAEKVHIDLEDLADPGCSVHVLSLMCVVLIPSVCLSCYSCFLLVGCGSL